MKRLIILCCSVLLSACGALESLGELQAQSSAAERAIEKDLGIKPFIGWHYRNGTFTSVEVTFESQKLPNMSVADLQTHVWNAVAANFKETPERLVVAVSSKP